MKYLVLNNACNHKTEEALNLEAQTMKLVIWTRFESTNIYIYMYVHKHELGENSRADVVIYNFC